MVSKTWYLVNTETKMSNLAYNPLVLPTSPTSHPPALHPYTPTPRPPTLKPTHQPYTPAHSGTGFALLLPNHYSGCPWQNLEVFAVVVHASQYNIYRLAQSTVVAKYAFKNNSITILMSHPSFPANIQHGGLRRIHDAYTATRGYQRWSLR